MTSANTTAELHLAIPFEHRSFPDHFPGAPLVPGALLLKWILAVLADQQHFNIRYIKQVKFLAPVQPGDQVRLCLVSGKHAHQLGIDAYVGETLVLKGQFESDGQKASTDAPGKPHD